MSAAGGPEALKLRKALVPVPAVGEVLIRVAAAGVNRHDCKQRRRGTSRQQSSVLGLEVAGTIVAIGPGVDEWAAGDCVQLDTSGTLLAIVSRDMERYLSSSCCKTLPPRPSTKCANAEVDHLG